MTCTAKYHSYPPLTALNALSFGKCQRPVSSLGAWRKKILFSPSILRVSNLCVKYCKSVKIGTQLATEGIGQ